MSTIRQPTARQADDLSLTVVTIIDCPSSTKFPCLYTTHPKNAHSKNAKLCKMIGLILSCNIEETIL